MSTPTIVHFEIPSDNIERANKFYTELFGWKMEKMPGPMEYWMFAKGANNKGEQTISGGVMERKIPSSHEQITIYIAVNSVNEYVKRVEELGGKVIKPKTEVRSYGWFALCMDTENNIFALWEANTK